MNRPSGTDLPLASWMQDGPTSGPADLLSSALEATRSTRQRPGWLSRWSDPPAPMRRAAMAGTVVSAVLLAVIGFGLVLWPSNSGVGGPRSGPGQGARSTPSPMPVSSPVSSPSACSDDSVGCLGLLAAGVHIAPQFGVTFTVPAGWKRLAESPDWFLLAPQDGTATNTGEWLAVFADAVVSAQPPDCSSSPLPGVGHTADAIATYLTHHHGLVTSNVTRVTIGGLAGESLDLSLATSWTAICPGSGGPEVAYLTQDNESGYQWSVGGTEHQHMTLLDDGRGGVIAIAINSPTAEGFEAFVQAATPIVNSFSFRPGSASPSNSPSARP